MKNILLLQFRKNSQIAKHEKKCILRYLDSKINLVSKNLFRENVDFNNTSFSEISGIIIGGSGEFSFSKKKKRLDLLSKIEQITPFIKRSIKKNTPILGICLGCQYLAYILGAEVRADKFQEEVGTFKVSLTKLGRSDRLFFKTPLEFFTHEGHKDSIDKLPKGTVLLAGGKKCKIQSFRLKNKNVYGVQFHPELNVKDMKFRQRHYQSYAPGNKKISIESSFLAKRILKNFFSLVREENNRK